MTNTLFNQSFQFCMLYYLIEINENLFIFNISLIYKQFFSEDAFSKLNKHEFPL